MVIRPWGLCFRGIKDSLEGGDASVSMGEDCYKVDPPPRLWTLASHSIVCSLPLKHGSAMVPSAMQ